MIKATPWLENIIAGGFVRAIAGTDPTNALNQVARHVGASASVRIRSGRAPTHEDRLNWASCPVENANMPAWCDGMLALLDVAVPNSDMHADARTAGTIVLT